MKKKKKSNIVIQKYIPTHPEREKLNVFSKLACDQHYHQFYHLWHFISFGRKKKISKKFQILHRMLICA